MRAVDTNVLLRLITRDDATQVAAAERFVESGAWISHLVLAETAWVLDSIYGLGPAQVAAALDMLVAHRTLTVEAPEVVAVALGQFRKRPSLGFSDCLIIEIARKAGHLPVGTFDRNLGKLDGVQRL